MKIAFIDAESLTITFYKFDLKKSKKITAEI